MEKKIYRRLTPKEIHSLLLEIMDEIHRVCEKGGIEYYLLYGSALGQARVNGFIPWDDDMDLGMLRPEFERFKKAFYEFGDQNKFFLQLFETDKDYIKPVMRVCMNGTYLPVPSYMNHLRMNKSFYIDIFPLDNIADATEDRKKQVKDVLHYKSILEKRFCFIFASNGLIKRLAKNVIAFIYKLYPQNKAYGKMQEAMQRYDNVDTKEICALTLCYGEKRETLQRRYLGKPTLRTFESRSYFFPEKMGEYLTHMYGKDYLKVPPRTLVRTTHDIYIENTFNPYVVGFAVINEALLTKDSVKYLEYAAQRCDYLFVGVNASPIKYENQSDLFVIVNTLSCVYKTIIIENGDYENAWNNIHFQVLFVPKCFEIADAIVEYLSRKEVVIEKYK